MRICLFGGSFDPVHEGHLRLARSALSGFGLDKMIWMPAAQAPNKDRPGASFDHRLSMLKLLLEGSPQFEISTLEAALPQPSYTIHTLEELIKIKGEGHAWYLLIGSDNWTTFSTWKDWRRILSLVEVIVYPRADDAGEPALDNLPSGVHALEGSLLPVKSSDIRRAFRERGDWTGPDLPESIREYILAHNMYRNETHV